MKQKLRGVSWKMKPIKKKYASKDLNIAYNDGYDEAIEEVKKIIKK